MLKVDIAYLAFTALIALAVLAMALPAYADSIQDGGWHTHPHTEEWCANSIAQSERGHIPSGCRGFDKSWADNDAPQEATVIILTAIVMALLVREIDRKAARAQGVAP